MAEKKNLGTASLVSSMNAGDTILIENGGSVRRITLTDFTNAIQTNDLDVRLYAWGVPIKQSIQTSQEWGRVGNLDMWEAYKAKIGRYLLSADGTKMAKLSRTNSQIYEDGTTVDESIGNVMFYGLRLYFDLRESATDGYPTLWMSELPIGKHYIEKQIKGAYKGSLVDGKLVSRSGLTPRVSTTISNFWNYAQANGELYGLVDWDFMTYLMMLLLSEYGNPNSQEMVGYGCCGSTSVDWQTEANTLLTGATVSLGDSCGNIPISSANYSLSNASRVNLFGVEDYWGWVWEMAQGCYFGNSGNDAQDGTEVFIYKGNRLPSSDELATQPNGDFRKLTRAQTTDSWWWVKEMVLGEYFDLILKTNGGGSNQYWGDGQYGSATGQLCLGGGRADSGSYCGLACGSSGNAWSNSGSNCGSRLAYYGTPSIVSGADM